MMNASGFSTVTSDSFNSLFSSSKKDIAFVLPSLDLFCDLAYQVSGSATDREAYNCRAKALRSRQRQHARKHGTRTWKSKLSVPHTLIHLEIDPSLRASPSARNSASWAATTTEASVST